MVHANLAVLASLITVIIFQCLCVPLMASSSTNNNVVVVGTKSVIFAFTSLHKNDSSNHLERTHNNNSNNNNNNKDWKSLKEKQKSMWLDHSITYYSKVMREERRRRMGQMSTTTTSSSGGDYHSSELQQQQQQQQQQSDDYIVLAKKHYFALQKIKHGKLKHAERIYRRIINEILQEGDDDNAPACDHAKLAVTTLLLALLLQRMGDRKATRSVFLHFFRIAILDRKEQGLECACSAKVLQAYALFEMKQGHSRKSVELVMKAIELDRSLEPILQWKQFRDELERQSLRP